MEKNKLNLVIIGAGKIAGTLVPSLLAVDCNISAVISRSKNSARELAEKNGIKIFSDNYADIPKEANFFILSVSDSAIAEAADQLAEADINFKSSSFIHLSGSLNSSELNLLAAKGGKTGSLHIMQSFPDKESRCVMGAYSAYEAADEELEKTLLSLCDDLKLHPFRIDPANKFLYHLCGGYASNFFAAQFYFLRKNFSEMGIPEDKMYDIFLPMIRSTIWNIEKLGWVKSLSGPVERGDVNVIKGHLEALKGDGVQLKFYAAGSLALLETAKEKGSITAEKYAEIKEVLANYL